MDRRLALRSLAYGAGALAALSSGVLSFPVLAADNRAAFDATKTDAALKNLGIGPTQPGEFVIKAPEIAENGMVVPVEVESKVPNTDMLWVLVDGNPSPLAAQVSFPRGTEAYANLRIKMAQTSRVDFIARADGKFYAMSKEIKITLGGCGG